MKLSASRITSVLTLLGENVTDADEAADVARHYKGVLETIADRELDAEISVKLTQLGIDIGSDVATANLESILATAEERGQFVWIDVESSDYVDRTLDMYRAARSRHSNTGVCLQAYLYRTAGGSHRSAPDRPCDPAGEGVRTPSQRRSRSPARKMSTGTTWRSRRHFSTRCSGAGVRVAFATHDEQLIRRIEKEAAQRGIARGDLEFQMLFGIGTAEQEELAAKGYRVQVLISYGTAWFPWYMRRLAERPANPVVRHEKDGVFLNGDPDPSRWRALFLVSLAVLLGMSVWFTASAVAPELERRWDLSSGQVGWLTTLVQLGFVSGTILAAVMNLADVVSSRGLLFDIGRFGGRCEHAAGGRFRL